MRARSASLLFALSLSVFAAHAACGGSPATTEAASSGSATTGAGGKASSSATGMAASTVSGGPTLTGSGGSGGSTPDMCSVDILFVVDNSGSMQEHAPATIAAFDTFVNEMISALPKGTSLHVGLTRATGFYDPGNGGGWSGPTCEPALTDGTWNPPDVSNNGTNGQQGRLFEFMSKRYYDTDTSADPAPLKAWFEGAMQGAIDGSDPHSNTETPTAGAAYPFHPANATFNQGFMRQQAVLVLFLLSDSPDLAPASVPESEIVKIVSDAKAQCGDQCVLATGAIAGACYGDPQNTNTRLYDFMNGFGKPPPSWVNLEAGSDPDYKGVLGKALANVINTTCETISMPK